MMRANRYDAATRHADRSSPYAREAFAANLRALLATSSATAATEYAIPAGALTDPSKQRQLAAFFFWTLVGRVDQPPRRHGHLHEQLAARAAGRATARPATPIVWTGVSILMLLAGIGAMAFWYAGAAARTRPPDRCPTTTHCWASKPTPSQRATLKYFWVVVGAASCCRSCVGVITAHYGVEGNGFYGFPLDDVLPYSVTRTWHVQLGIFWIATAWLAAGLFIAPAVGGVEPTVPAPRRQRALRRAARRGRSARWPASGSASSSCSGPPTLWFYFGHSGYEYIDLGRAWQIALLDRPVPLARPDGPRAAAGAAPQRRADARS